MTRAAATLLFVVLLSGCALLFPGTEEAATTEPGESDVLRDSTLAEFQHGDPLSARALAVQFIGAYPEDPAAAGFRLSLARSYYREQSWDLALFHLAKLSADYPSSKWRREGQLLEARVLVRTGHRLEAACRLDAFVTRWRSSLVREEALATLLELLDRGLGAAELEGFLARRGASPRSGQAQLALAERLLQENRREDALSRLDGILSDRRLKGAHKRAREIQARASLPTAGEAASAEVALREGRVGVLAPLSGRFMLYGEAFIDGARLALARFNAEHLTRFEMVSGDTRGEPVQAALAARHLVRQEGVAVLLGAVLSNPTIAAAVEANGEETALLSPSATAENIHQIGDWVFQNRVSSSAEVLALAHFAIDELLAARFAVLYSRQGNGQELAQLFARTIEDLGGEVVGTIGFETGVTDYQEQLDAVREQQPEVLFLPGEVDQLMLIVPQIAYHNIHAQILGNEAWNSPRLIRHGGQRCEGAIFPSDVLLKRDRELYRSFVALYEGRYAAPVNPVSARAFLGMTTVLEAFGDGAMSRAEIRERLDRWLNAAGDDAERLDFLADQVLLMTVENGEILPYGSSSALLPAD